MIPDPDAIEKALLRLEVGVNKHGWDQKHMLFVVLHAGGDRYRFESLEVPNLGGMGETLHAFADALDNTDIGAFMIEHLAKNNFAGLAAVFEAWNNVDLTPEQYREHKAAGRGLADIVGSYETRVVFCADAGGGMCMISRRRRHRPQLGFVHLGGQVISSVAQMTLSVARRLPADQADLAKIEAFKPTTMEEAQAIIDARHQR